ncbi:MAG: BadF/BadG/BcrA/BcrD ATPase family protein [Pseudomonadota bacterium]
MHGMLDAAILAIDGGGTRCRIAYEQVGETLRIDIGPANVYTDFDGAISRIQDGLSQLTAELGVDRQTLFELPAYVGLAGLNCGQDSERLRVGLPFETIRIEDDRPAAVRGALGDSDGAIIHCGTGSFYALQHSGHIQLAGGWGPILGDEASANWLGKMALSAALKVQDGRLPPSELATSLLSHLGGVGQLESFALRASPADFGALAPRVTKAASKGERLALSIVQEGARQIAEAATKLGWTPGMTLCLTGGVAPAYRPYLPQTLQQAIRQPLGEPIDGALSLARELIGADS